ncbi:MAG: outer membrane lipoprotein carrier protein LolA, partial [Myxococcota bacterium]|nr:outer membrane lipoprotein carrier protein LolA [Myxococcota bacterium]
PGVVARFREVKEIGMLSVPLEVRGTLWFVPPDRLARVTTEPSRTRLVIDGDRFAFHDEAGGESLDLAANPLAREFVENFIVLFGGDPQALRARYEPQLHLDGEAWRLVLRPRHRPLADVVERVTLEGEGRRLARMELRETDGDRTTTHFLEVDAERRFDEEELARIFGASGLSAPPGPAPAPAEGATSEAR